MPPAVFFLLTIDTPSGKKVGLDLYKEVLSAPVAYLAWHEYNTVLAEKEFNL